LKRSLSIYIIFVPIIFVLIAVISLTIHNIHNINKNGDKQIDEYTNDYLINEKTKIYNRIHFFANIIKHKTNEYKRKNRDKIRVKTEDALFLMKEIYEQNKNKYSKEKLKKLIISEIEKLKVDIPNSSYGLIDLKSEKIVSTRLKSLLNMNISNFVDVDGKKLINNEKKFDRFFDIKLIKYDEDYTFYNKLIYVKKFEELDLAILYGEYEDDINDYIGKTILQNILDFDIENNPYIFVIKLKNINGGDNYGEILLHQAKPSLAGKSLNVKDDNKDIEHYRKDYLSKIKEFGEGFVTYNYSRPDSNNISRKMSYFYLQKDWNWIIGTGFYFDDLENSIKDFKYKIEKQTRENIQAAIFLSSLLSVLILIILFFISNRINNIINNYANNLNNTNEKLRKQKNIFQTLFEKSSDGILIYDQNGLIKNCNDSMVKILGYEEKELLVGKYYKNLSPKKQFDGEDSSSKSILINNICLEKQTYDFDWLFYKKDRKVIFCNVISTKIELNGELVIHSTIRDITDKKELEQKSKKQQLMLAEESKKSAMGEMITMIAHQWRQPLNNVNLLIHFVRDNFDNEKFTKNDLKNITADMKTQIEYMSKTIDDFTNFINPKKEVTTFCIEDVYEKTYSIIKGQFSKNNIKIIKNIEHIEITGIENEFMQVMLNILNNAKDSLLSIEDERLVFINVKSSNNRFILTIKDNAGGIPKKVLSRIFEPYFTTKHKSNGTGIGLYMSEEIIKQFKNGSIKATNEHYYYENKFYEGAMFTISFDLN